MSYLKKTTTLLLFLLLLASIIVFLVSIIFYQKSFTKLNDKVVDKDEEIKILSSEAEKMKANLEKLNNALNLQLKREENLSGQYVEVKSLKEKVEEQKIVLDANLNKTSKELKDAKDDIAALNIQVTDLSLQYSSVNKSYSAVLKDTTDICNTIKSVINVSKCKKYTS